MLCEQRREAAKLYDPYRNLYLDKCYAEGKMPLGEWMNFSTDDDETTGRPIRGPAGDYTWVVLTLTRKPHTRL